MGGSVNAAQEMIEEFSLRIQELQHKPQVHKSKGGHPEVSWILEASTGGEA